MQWNSKLFRKKHVKPIKSFSSHDRVLFFQELGELLQSGYSLAQSLDILASAHVKWQDRLNQIIDDLNHGIKLHTALEPHVNHQIILQIKLADQHGNLSQTLVAIGKSLAKLQQQEHKVAQVMRYPLILLGILGLMLVGLKYFLFPILNQWQNETTTVDALNHTYAYLFIGTVVLLLFGVCMIWRSHTPRQRLILLVHIPIIGKIIETIITYQVAQQLAILLSSGVTVPEILDDISQSHKKDMAVALVKHARQSLEKGETIEAYVLKQPYLNRSLAGYFARGHEPRVLADYLAYYAKTQFQLLMQQTDRLIGTLQPLFFGIIGLAIVGLYMSMLLPMYQSIGGLYQ